MVRMLSLLAACLLATGCFAFDEIDKGMATLDKGPKEKPAAAQAGKPAPGEEGKPSPQAWWASAHSLNQGPSEAAEADAADPSTPVSCRVGGSTRFMRRGDCLSQGGQPR